MSFQVAIGPYSLRVTYDKLPSTYGEATRHAVLVDEHDLASGDGTLCCVEVGNGNAWPFLIASQRYSPSANCFFPGVLIVPETARMFVGAGERLLAYDLSSRERLWEDSADVGFWSWARHDDVVVMSAELELAAWDLLGRKLWSRFVEPPWEYAVVGNVVHLDIMGAKSEFDLRSGPPPIGT
jgi:hypothetical protein